jgi:hypothetical protein
VTTLTVVKKGDRVAIAADGLTTFGDTRLARSYKGEHDKILDIAGSMIGICGSSAHHLVLQSAFSKLEDVKLGSRMEVYETFRRLHPVLKEHAFLNPKEDDDDPYESSQIQALIANSSRHLRRLFLSRSVRVRPLLGGRLGPQLRAGRHARALRRANSPPPNRRSRRRRRHRVRYFLGAAHRGPRVQTGRKAK